MNRTLTDAEFAAAWNAAPTIDAAAVAVGRTKRSATYRAWALRRRGETLKRFPAGRGGHPARPLASLIRKTDGCWEWMGLKDPDGSGRVYRGGRRVSARQAVYAEFVGPVPAGAVIAATCSNPACVRPEHLVPAGHSSFSRAVRKALRERRPE